MSKEKKKEPTTEQEFKAFEEFKKLAKELGFKGATGLKNTLWVHIEEIRRLKIENKKLGKYFGESMKELESQKADFFKICCQFEEMGKAIFNALEITNKLLNNLLTKK